MKPGREAEDDRADNQAYDQAVIPYRSPGRSLRSFEELRAIGVAREAFFDELGRPTALMEGFRRCVSLHDFPAVSVNFAEPEALLLDEPFAKLDMALREDFRRLVFAHARSRGLPTILVTHDEADARAAGGTVLRLDTG